MAEAKGNGVESWLGGLVLFRSIEAVLKRFGVVIFLRGVNR